MSKKKITPRRVSIETRANGEVHLAIRGKSPNFSIAKDRKKEANKNRCRQTTGDFYFARYRRNHCIATALITPCKFHDHRPNEDFRYIVSANTMTQKLNLPISL